MLDIKEFNPNPLDYDKLSRDCVKQLMKSGPYRLPLSDRFLGAGVYALFYKGHFSPYSSISSEDALRPIYVGSAQLSGTRKGRVIGAKQEGTSLYNRIGQHLKSIKAVSNLNTDDFVCRFLVVTPLWITMVEKLLIDFYHPIWNSCLDGFGNHNPGKGRHKGEITWWDAMHPGRSWSSKLRQVKTQKMAIQRLDDFFAGKASAKLDEETEIEQAEI
jgi:hypothetical protein